MLTILAAIAAIAAAPPPTQPTEVPPPKPPGAEQGAKSRPDGKPASVCTVKKVGKILGHEVTHKKCVDPKPAQPSST
ncbi:hypothetical protein [Phenylobacterium kunshanense]|uniref:Uncharacterized protein n=1 Tax=Phenylobacterium kunshanense TaxID=1445034 RepID=A0A328BIL8_9CAUL|nr:hypothetical protein [Phenylobacterium kunshanense]RAK66479.1 hypothetical protein DJ019_09565 [Phenylobacterium kunshanense]